MAKNLLIADNFLPDPQGFRDEAILHPFVDIRFHGAVYKQIQVRATDEHRELIETVVGRDIVQDYSFLRLNLGGELPHNAVHCDADCGGFAAILYLNLPEQCRGGTALWKHKETGYDAVPAEHEVRRTGKSHFKTVDKIRNDWNDLTKWEQVGLAEMKWNRLAVYPAHCFHSRWPGEAFGKDRFDGRLVWVTFFECK